MEQLNGNLIKEIIYQINTENFNEKDWQQVSKLSNLFDTSVGT
jgi:hypothetical protein